MSAKSVVSVVIIRAVNPPSVVCEESILVNALLTLGVPEHPDPAQAYVDRREALPDGKIQRTLQWVLLTKSRDGLYETQKLIAWWRDEKWIAANPTHELATIKVASENMLRMARRIAQTPHVDVIRRGKRQLHLPSHLSEELKKAKLEEFLKV